MLLELLQLNENRVDFLRNQYESKLKPTEFDQLLQFDPTKKKIYLQWIIKQFLGDKFRLEDKSRVVDNLTKLDSIKHKPQVEGDINKYDWYSLQDAIDEIYGKELTTDTNYSIPNVKVLYDGPLGKLLIPETEEASCELGKGTRWCTAARQNNAFDRYNDKGPLYVWIDKNGDKYQFHFETTQFMDDKDTPIDNELINQFRTQHPILSKLFKMKEKEIMKDPDRAYRYVIDIIKGRWPEAEPYIMKNPGKVYLYARDVIEGRWPEAEPYIMKDPKWAHDYAKYVMHGRWPEAEPYIMKHPNVAYQYAIDLIKGRWPEAEPYIMKDPLRAYLYAVDVIKGRWPEAEPYIMKNPEWAHDYAKYVIKGRWPEAEPYIMKDPQLWKRYKDQFNIKK